MFKYLVAVGSNIGDRHQYISQAIEELKKLDVLIESQSTLIETMPVGAADQTFLNGAFVCRSPLGPENFLEVLLKVESSLGRRRDVKWGNRTIDLDILLAKDPAGDEVNLSSSKLTIPHPQMWNRPFVMTPAQEIWGFTKSELSFKENVFTRVLKDKYFSAVLLITLLLRWYFAFKIPFGNDEAYYWDWGREVHLSYYDHPPIVSWIAWLGELIIPSSFTYLSGRFFVPVCHLVATLFLLRICELLVRRPLSKIQKTIFLLATQGIPAFSLGGMMLMPDIGLILFSTVSIYYLLSIYRLPRLSAKHGVLLGLFFGLSGLSKYHAFFIASGSLLFVLWKRREQVLKEIDFWLGLVGAGLLTVFPVIYWNSQHDWVSFLFQGTRGFSKEGFKLIPAAQTLVGEMVFLGPLMVVGLWTFFKSRIYKEDLVRILICAALPLLIVLKVLSFTSQALPHWTMPSFWLMIPLIVLSLKEKRKTLQCSFGYALLFCLVVPSLLSSSGIRNSILKMTKNRPGGFGELTLWDTAKGLQELQEYIASNEVFNGRDSTHCPSAHTLASTRWYSTAQMAANLSSHPKVLNLDLDHMSYYTFRDKLYFMIDCPVTIIAEEATSKSLLTSSELEILDIKKFNIGGHEDRPMIGIKGIYRGK